MSVELEAGVGMEQLLAQTMAHPLPNTVKGAANRALLALVATPQQAQLLLAAFLEHVVLSTEVGAVEGWLKH